MNVRKKQFILLSVIGAVIGIAIWLIMLLTHNPKALSDGSHSSGIIILNVILSAVFGALCMGGAVVYDILIWLFQYLIFKRKVKELNRELENWKSIQKTEK